MGELEKIINEINKQYPGSVMRLGKCAYIKKKRVSTGSFALNMATGGGIPEGSIIEMFGPLSSGKTFSALKLVAQVQKLGREAAYIDLENLDLDWAKKLGVDIDKLIFSQPSSAEQVINTVDKLLRSGELGIIVIDSIASMAPLVEIETEAEDQQMGVAARLNNKMIRKVRSALQPKDLGDKESHNRCIAVFINQIRMKIGGYGNPETTPGGKGLGFASDIRIRLNKKEWIQEGTGVNKKTIGQVTVFKTVKNKTYEPFRVGTFNIYFKDGSVDNYASIIQYGIFYEYIKRAGAIYTFEKKKFKGKVALIKYLKANPKLVDKLKTDIKRALFRGNEEE